MADTIGDSAHDWTASGGLRDRTILLTAARHDPERAIGQGLLQGEGLRHLTPNPQQFASCHNWCRLRQKPRAGRLVEGGRRQGLAVGERGVAARGPPKIRSAA